MGRLESRLIRAAVGVGAVIWLARLLVWRGARREAEVACSAVDEAVEFGGLRSDRFSAEQEKRPSRS